MPLLAKEFNPRVAQSLVRLGRLAQENRQLIDLVVGPLLESAMVSCSNVRVELACGPLVGQSLHLVREMFVRLWRDQGWPRMDMAEGKWSQLAELAQTRDTDPAAFTLPGEIQVRRCDETIVLERLSPAKSR